MGQMIKITYVGAFIVPELKNFQQIKDQDDFYEEFFDTEKFRTAYQGLETIDVLIPLGNGFSIKDQENYHEEFIIDNFTSIKELENVLRESYKDTIDRLKELYPDGKFTVRSGIISYWDEIA